MAHAFDHCPSCGAALDPGFLSSPSGCIQWTDKAPGLVSRLLATGDVLVDPSGPSLLSLHGWRCPACGLILLGPLDPAPAPPAP